MNAIELITELKRKFEIKTNRALAARLGMSEVALNNWTRRKTPLTPRQIANALKSSAMVAVASAQRGTIKALVEFFPIDVAEVGKVGKYEVIPTGKDSGQHYTGLRKVLEGEKGLYIFYDTRGKALYAGQTKRQNIWKEMNLAFNRDRSAQMVTLARHPKKDVAFLTANEKVRQPTSVNLKLHDLAAYFSAFAVADGMIDELEALLVRAFPNDLLNYKMEKFGKGDKPKAPKKAKSVLRKKV